MASSCSDDDEYYAGEVWGAAVAQPDTVKNGDESILSIGAAFGGIFSATSSATINGKSYHAVVHYLIDSVEVVVSKEKDLPFSATYVVRNLSVGEHTLSVEVKGNRKGAHFTSFVSSSKIFVTE